MKTNKIIAPLTEEIMPLLIGVWRRFTKNSGPADSLQTREFRDVVKELLEYRSGNATEEDYFKKPSLLAAYILYDWMVHYQQGLALIGEVPGGPKRVLDLASGPGAFAFAASRHGAKEVIALDRNADALRLAGQISGRYGYALTARKHNVLRFPYPVEGKFDLIIVGHCLTELFPDSGKGATDSQKNWCKRLFELLTPGGMILFVEDSLPPANRRLLSLRDRLVTEGFPVQAPCVWKGECPALQTQNPCYAQRDFEKPHLIKNIQRACGINLSSLKMSYLLMRNPESGWPHLPDRPVYRVISPATETHAGKRFHLCGTDGKKDLGTRLKEHPPESRTFDFLHTQRGILISAENASVNQNHFDIVLGTRIKVEAALNKPLPEKDPSY